MNTDEQDFAWPARLEAARAGDGDALSQLLEWSEAQLRLIAASTRLDSRLRAKLSESDLVQDSLIEIADRLASFGGATTEEFRDWARRILQHNTIDARRKFLQAERRDVRRETDLTAAGRFYCQTDSPSAAARRCENDRALAAAIEELPEHYRTAIHLRHEQGLGWEEIGAKLGISAEAARKLWARAVKRLQHQLISEESRVA